MPLRNLVFFVEGHGDEEAIAVLIRRIAQGIDPSLVVVIPHQVRSSKGQLLKEDDFLRYMDRARRYIGTDDAVLVLMDADDDCPKKINQMLMSWATTNHSDLRVAVVVAKREMESWFVAGAESLKAGLGVHADAEDYGDPKSWVGKNILGAFYAPSADQARLAAALDIEMARCVQSFNKFVKDVVRLLA